ncbi:hypothetical protein ACILE9_05545 [Capnocytophaga cynodegmi]|uniref:hypothetical protein n=1 Tax=Capnocytophaga cynodegmi TaxID=28189 RepID=UPI0037D199AF
MNTFEIDFLEKINEIFTLNIYSDFVDTKFNEDNYRVIGDDGYLKIGINSKGELYGINIDDNQFIYIQKSINIFICCLQEFVKLSHSQENDEIKIRSFIKYLINSDKVSISRNSWWYLFLSNAGIDGVDIDKFI